MERVSTKRFRGFLSYRNMRSISNEVSMFLGLDQDSEIWEQNHQSTTILSLRGRVMNS